MPGSRPHRRGRHRGIEVLPEAVRAARLEAGMSMAQVADGKLSRAAIHLIETGRMRPSMDTLSLIARRIGRPISHFLPGGGATDEQRRAVDELEDLVRRQEFGPAIELADRMLAEGLPAPVESRVRFALGTAYVLIDDGVRARPHLVRARTLFQQARDQWQVAEALDRESCALFLADDPRAVPTALEALDTCERLDPPQPALLVRILVHLGSFHYRAQRWTRAAECYQRALKLAAEVPGIRQLAMIHDGLGQLYQRLGQFGTAIEHMRRAYSLYQGTGEVKDLARAEHNLGTVLLRQGALASAEPHLFRALALLDEHGIDRQGRGYVLCSLAQLHLAKGQLDQAEERAHEALAVATSLNERGHQATANRWLAQVHLRRGAHAEAEWAFRQAIATLEELGQQEALCDCRIEYAEALQDQGRLAEALEHWRSAALAARQSMTPAPAAMTGTGSA